MWPKVGPARHVSRDSSSEDCALLARTWLSGCLTSHENCKRSGVPLLPSTVIEVGTTEDDTKLCITKKGQRGEYAALSHCWGGSDPITTTSATLKERTKGLSFGPSSKTFGEAVSFTRRLGIPYLWIDSLCIIQDSKEDWAKEAVQMSHVYNNATVTLSAASGIDSSSGLYPDPHDREEMNRVVEIPCQDREGGAAVAYARLRHDTALSTESTVHSRKPVEESKLRSRGWVLQEDLLSPRMLHFTKEELSWTCSTFTRCECRIRPTLPSYNPYRLGLGTLPRKDMGDLGYTTDPTRTRTTSDPVGKEPRCCSILSCFGPRKQSARKIEKQPAARSDQGDEMDASTALPSLSMSPWKLVESEDLEAALNLKWPLIVMDFTRRKLTVAADRMPALAGLAGWTEQQTDDNYMAGIWMKDAEYQLLWYVDRSAETAESAPSDRFPRPYAPSWSWTSVSGPISYYGRWPPGRLPQHPAMGSDSVQSTFRLIGHWEILNSLNVYGPVKHATLHLFCFVLPVTFDAQRGLWIPDRPMADLDPEALKINIDVPSEMPTVWDDVTAKSYSFILVARRRGHGMTIVSMQGVCLLARRMTRLEDLPLLGLSVRQGLDVTPDNSFQRVGLVRGAGSMQSWEKASDLLSLIYLL